MGRPSPAGTRPDDAKTVLVYDGRLAELCGIFFGNLILTIITFGIYRPWAITRMRRYLWSHMRFEGTPFLYTGKGKEILQGYVLAVLTVVLLFASAAAAQHALKRSNPAQAPLPYVTAIVGVLVLFGTARFAAWRYRLTRTEWRGISGGMAGSALRYGANRMIYLLTCVVTLGQAVPWMQVGLARWRIEACHFGSAVFRCDGRGRRLYPAWLAMIFGHIVLVGVIVAVVAGFEGAWLAHILFGRSKAPIAHDTAFKAMPAIVGALVIAVGSAMLVTSYQAKRFHLLLSNTTALMRGSFRNETLGFGTTAEVDNLSWLVFTNLAIVVLTCGLGTPVVLHRNARFLARTTCVTGTFDANTLTQGASAPSALGNGYLPTLDHGIV